MQMNEKTVHVILVDTPCKRPDNSGTYEHFDHGLTEAITLKSTLFAKV